MLRRAYIPIALILLLAAALLGCASAASKLGLSSSGDEFPEGAPIQLRVAVVYSGKYLHKGLDTNHNMGRVAYSFTLDPGAMIMRLLKERAPKMFTEVVFIPDISALKPGYLALVPKNIDLRTENEKIKRSLKCGSETYVIRAMSSMSLLLATPEGTPIVEHSASDIEERMEDWPMYCISGTQIGGAGDGDYESLLNSALRNTMARLEKRIMANAGAIQLYRELMASTPAPDLAYRWAHSAVIEALPPSIGRTIDPEPFATVALEVQDQMDGFLSPRTALAKRGVPRAVKRPVMPLPPDFKPDPDSPDAAPPTEEESFDEDFEEPGSSPNGLPEKREFRVIRLQEEYRNSVERRNKQVADIKEAFLKELDSINAEQEGKLKIEDQKYVEFVRSSLIDSMEGVFLQSASYDPEARALKAAFAANSALYVVTLSFPMTPEEATSALADKTQMMPLLEFAIGRDGVSVKDARLYCNGKTYLAALTAEDTKTVALDIKFNYRTLAFTDSDAQELSAQDPNLLDPYHVQAVAPGYSDEVKPEGFTEDLVEQVRAAEQKPQSPDRWLLAIGIENYTKADRVMFAGRSHAYFVDAAQKALGIGKDHIVSLADRQASAKTITSQVTELASKISAGDTVYLYYSGHIARDDQGDGRMFLVPSDLDPDSATEDITLGLDSIIDRLMDAKPARLVAFVDASPGGNTDGVPAMKGMRRSRPLLIPNPPDPSRVTLIMASKPSQSSNFYLEKLHRLFSYFLIRDLAKGENTGSIGQFVMKLSSEVSDTAATQKNSPKQEPQVFGNTQGPL